MTKNEMIIVLEVLFIIEEVDGNLILRDRYCGDVFAVLYFDNNNIYTGYDM